MSQSRDDFERQFLAKPERDRRRYLLRSGYRRLLYRYHPATDERYEHLRDLFVRSRLWLASQLSFNDPFDGDVAFHTTVSGLELREELLRIGKQHGVPFTERNKFAAERMRSGDFDIFARDRYQITRKTLGVHCFSGTPRNLVMWSHYADAHAGVCLGFDVARGFPLSAEIFEITYSKEFPILDWVRQRGEAFLKAVLRKHPDWSYEHEWRLARTGAANSYATFPPQMLRMVIVGGRADDKVRQRVTKLLKERADAGLPPVSLMTAHFQKDNYALRITR